MIKLYHKQCFILSFKQYRALLPSLTTSILIILLSILLQLSQIPKVFADVGSDMEQLFQSLGGGANYTKGGVYQTQSGGYYTGGSLYARLPTRNHQLMNLQPPSIKAGRGGIDLFAGSFSFINAQQLIKAMRGIMGNAVGYSFNLALQTFVPQVYNTMQKLNDIAREINNININSCETASQLVGGLWAKSDEENKQLCQAMGTSNGKFGDWARAKQECGVGGKRGEATSEKGDKFKHQLGDEFNIAWEAIKSQSLFGSDKELAELFMSISGTIVAKKQGTGEDVKIIQMPYSSKINSIELFDVFLFGESKSGKGATIYRCDGYDKCLEPKERELKINKKNALLPKIEVMLRNMTDKMRTHDAALTDNEKSLIELTQIPILRIIAVQNAFMVGNSAINVNEFGESIAYDYLLGYMERILDFVSTNLNQLEKVQVSESHIPEFKRDIAEIRRIISEKRFGSYQRMLTVISVIEKSNLVEKKLESMFTSYNQMKEL